MNSAVFPRHSLATPAPTPVPVPTHATGYAPCIDVFSGISGAMVLITLSVLAFTFYIGSYVFRRKVKKTESRTPFVFVLDLSKLAAGQGFAWAVNLMNADRNAKMNDLYDELSWYFPTFLCDEIFAVPLGVLLGKIVCWIARYFSYKYRFLRCLQHFGQYSCVVAPAGRDNTTSADRTQPVVNDRRRKDAEYGILSGGSSSSDDYTRCDGQGPPSPSALTNSNNSATYLFRDNAVSPREPNSGTMDGDASSYLDTNASSDTELMSQDKSQRPEAHWGGPAWWKKLCLWMGRESEHMWWWAVQCVTWVICVIISRKVGGEMLPLFETLFENADPFRLMSGGIYDLNWTCAAKRVLFAGLGRIVIDVIQIAVVDFFNKFVKGGKKKKAKEPETVEHGEEFDGNEARVSFDRQLGSDVAHRTAQTPPSRLYNVDAGGSFHAKDPHSYPL
eukprot:TRINITY_DN57270_c0_g1_i1.p1 TRINITY_DN57270_c0_g1~~TRINITY_DN57270_c0_g1_i1.p1  ORF type:complete len:446 (+),score=41.66 TRINITY_DN57270_c0_g1_i1:40-1377(+)